MEVHGVVQQSRVPVDMNAKHALSAASQHLHATALRLCDEWSLGGDFVGVWME